VQTFGKTILFVDDDDELREALSLMLERAGHRVQRAANGEQAVRLAAEEPPDLILLDFMMPEKSGFDASRELRRLPGLEEVPIIVLTAFGQNIGEIYGLPQADPSSNIVEYLEKPVEINILLERVNQALS
jgi:two-component system phosphate regulon response regulator PhoB